MDITEDFSDFLFSPIEMSAPLYEKASQGTTFSETLLPRLLFALSAAICKIALPLIALVGTVEVIVNACSGGDWRKSLCTLVTAATIFSIALPACVAAALLPSKFIVELAKAARNHLEEKMVNYFPVQTAI